MVVFLANRANLQSKRLHDRIRHRLSGEFDNVRRRRAVPREAGPYRVVADVNPRQFLDDDEYSVTTARVEIGFQLQTGEPHEYIGSTGSSQTEVCWSAGTRTTRTTTSGRSICR